MKRHHNWTEDIQWTSQLKIIVAKTFWRSIAPFLAKKTNESIRMNGKKTTRKKSLSTKISLKKILKFDYNPTDLESAYDIPTAYSKQCTAKLVGFCLYFFFYTKHVLLFSPPSVSQVRLMERVLNVTLLTWAPLQTAAARPVEKTDHTPQHTLNTASTPRSGRNW